MTAKAKEINWKALHKRSAEAERALARGYEDDPKIRDAILRDRAIALAARGRRERTHDGAVPVIMFTLGQERYALRLAALAAVVRGRALAAVPGGAAELVGTLYERGEVWAIHDLHALLGLPAGERPTGDVVLLLRDARRRVGLRVDAVSGIRRESLDGLSVDIDEDSQISRAFIRGVTGDALVVLRDAALWDHPAIKEIR